MYTSFQLKSCAKTRYYIRTVNLSTHCMLTEELLVIYGEELCDEKYEPGVTLPKGFRVEFYELDDFLNTDMAINIDNNKKETIRERTLSGIDCPAA